MVGDERAPEGSGGAGVGEGVFGLFLMLDLFLLEVLALEVALRGR